MRIEAETVKALRRRSEESGESMTRLAQRYIEEAFASSVTPRSSSGRRRTLGLLVQALDALLQEPSQPAGSIFLRRP